MARRFAYYVCPYCGKSYERSFFANHLANSHADMVANADIRDQDAVPKEICVEAEAKLEKMDKRKVQKYGPG